jgi:hypothetical protein
VLRRTFKFSLRLGVLVALVAIAVKLLEDRESPPVLVSSDSEDPNLRTQEPAAVAHIEPEPEMAAERPARAPLRAELIADPEPAPVRADRKVPIDHPPAEKRAAMVSWVEPHGAVCPTSHPIKAKLGSKVFRKPETPGYDNSKPDRCYASEGAARRAGFREAQR